MKTLQQGLKEWVKKNNFPIHKEKQSFKKTPEKKKTETLSKRDLNELMGTNMRTWKRGRGGALRQ